jgi:ABC-type ATPase with predicted acetyltransferase domain
MPLQRDLREFIESLNSHQVEYLIIGAFALAFHGVPRFTGDIDILVRRSPENAARIERVLVHFSFASPGLSADDFIASDRIVQLGHPPNELDRHSASLQPVRRQAQR